MTELLVFSVCIALGALIRPAFFVVNTVAKSVKLRPITFVLDCALVLLFFAAFVIFITVINDGVIAPYMFVSSLLAFCLVSKLMKTRRQKRAK